MQIPEMQSFISFKPLRLFYFPDKSLSYLPDIMYQHFLPLLTALKNIKLKALHSEHLYFRGFEHLKPIFTPFHEIHPILPLLYHLIHGNINPSSSVMNYVLIIFIVSSVSYHLLYSLQQMYALTV